MEIEKITLMLKVTRYFIIDNNWKLAIVFLQTALITWQIKRQYSNFKLEVILL